MTKIVKVEKTCQSRLFTVESVHLEFSNGEKRIYERVRGSSRPSVMVLPLLDENTILLVREYSVGVESYTLGFPKGLTDPGEDILMTADRELQEEAGYGAKELEYVTTCAISPGYFSATMSIVLAKDLYPASLPGDEPEPLEVVEWSLDKVDELLAHPEFVEARSMFALLWLERSRRAN